MLDFKEIQDPYRFEEFAEMYFKAIGMNIIKGSAVGQDGGKDLVVEEVFESTVLSKPIHFKWLVSVKHNAISGKSVGCSDENNFRDRIEENNCEGIILFMSTRPTEGLCNHLKDLKKESHIIKGIDIEKKLLNDGGLKSLFIQFFPESYFMFCEKDLIHQHEFLFQKTKYSVGVYPLKSWIGCINDWYLKYKINDKEPIVFYKEITGHSYKFYDIDLDNDGIKELIITYHTGGHCFVALIFRLFLFGEPVLIGEIFNDQNDIKWVKNNGTNKYDFFSRNYIEESDSLVVYEYTLNNNGYYQVNPGLK